jgi:hypothetical protein
MQAHRRQPGALLLLLLLCLTLELCVWQRGKGGGHPLQSHHHHSGGCCCCCCFCLKDHAAAVCIVVQVIHVSAIDCLPQVISPSTSQALLKLHLKDQAATSFIITHVFHVIVIIVDCLPQVITPSTGQAFPNLKLEAVPEGPWLPQCASLLAVVL